MFRKSLKATDKAISMVIAASTITTSNLSFAASNKTKLDLAKENMLKMGFT